MGCGFNESGRVIDMENSVYEVTSDDTCLMNNGPFKLIVTSESVEGLILPDTQEVKESLILGNIQIFGEK